jgi:hypothetical protein
MGILSSLFGNSEQNSNSFVRNWEQEAKRNLKQKGGDSNNVLFYSMIQTLTCFLSKKSRAQIDDMYYQMLKNSDAVLFELGVYLYLRADMWFILNRSTERIRVCTYLSKQFISLFQSAITNVEIVDIFDNRMANYEKMVQSDATVGQYHFIIAELIMHSGNDKLCKWDFDHISLVLDAIHKHIVNMELFSFEKRELKRFLEMLEMYPDCPVQANDFKG